jgi:outer membrane protein with beta-barrel domain
MTSRTIARIVTLAFPLLAAAPVARAQEAPAFAKNGLYVSASALPDFSFDGVTFDGASVYQQIGGEEIILLPKLEPTSTFRGTVGFRLSRGSFEVGYERTRHDATFMGLSGEATFKTLNFDERIYVLTRGRIQPYGLLGFSIPWLTITDGSALGDRVGDGTFHGLGVNTEAGVTVFAHPRVGVSVGYRYRAMWFDRARGVTDTDYELHPRFRETAGSLALGVSFTF